MNKTFVAIIVIIVVAGGVWWSKGGMDVSAPDSSASPTAVVKVSKTPSPAGGAKATATPAATPAPTQVLSYTQLVQQFGENRIQFDADCRATPKAAAFKNGARILLDNRSSSARTITVDGKAYALGSFGYQVITLSSSSVPKQLSVNCNSQVNAATINLQANISGE